MNIYLPYVFQLTKREIEKKKLEELNDLFKPVQQQQKIAAGKKLYFKIILGFYVFYFTIVFIEGM